MKYSQVAFHFTGAAMFWFGVYYDWVYVKLPPELMRPGQQYAGKLKFLTYWNALIQATFFTLALICDMTEYKPLTALKNRILASIAFPLSMFVGVTFWTLWAVDRELIMPRRHDPYFPAWLNHLMHTNIMVFAAVELVTIKMTYPKRWPGMKPFFLLMVVYLAWIHFVYYRSGYWIYPVLALGWPVKLAFYLICFVVVMAAYLFGEWLFRLTHGKKKK